MSQLTETPQQRDRARTIFEKSRPGRRAFVAPELDVPEDRDALPERFRRIGDPHAGIDDAEVYAFLDTHARES